MTTVFRVLAMLILVAGATKTGLADETAAIKELNGEWSAVSMEVGGMPLPETFVKSVKLVNTDGEYLVKAGKDDKGTVSVDPSKKPKTMTIKGTEGPNKGKTMLCIYELNGDELKICYDLSGAEFPKEFKSEKGKPNLMLAVYKKSK